MTKNDQKKNYYNNPFPVNNHYFSKKGGL
jgi:hypothetical protein